MEILKWKLLLDDEEKSVPITTGKMTGTAVESEWRIS